METPSSNNPDVLADIGRDRSGARIQKSDSRKSRQDWSQEMSHIQGWGADLERENRPAVPMERMPPRLDGVTPLDQLEDQPIKMKIYHSTERPGVTPLFGTSTPPSGLSGRLRDVAYRWSENDLRHWLLLLLADRINVVEGIAQDLGRGHVPNIYAEMGGPAELKYNPAGLAKKALIASALAGAGYYLLRRRSARRRALAMR
jgi:hypothetical protein